jgi:hypothetical protein
LLIGDILVPSWSLLGLLGSSWLVSKRFYKYQVLEYFTRGMSSFIHFVLIPHVLLIHFAFPPSFMTIPWLPTDAILMTFPRHRRQRTKQSNNPISVRKEISRVETDKNF